MVAHFVSAHPLLAVLALLGALSVVVSFALLVALAVFELERAVRSRRTRRQRGGYVDFTRARL